MLDRAGLPPGALAWARALTVRERIALVRGVATAERHALGSPALARRRAAAWLPLSPASDLCEEMLLAALGLSGQALVAALSPPPPWLETLLEAYGATNVPVALEPGATPVGRLAAFVDPLLVSADRAIASAVAREPNLRGPLREGLATRLLALAIRTLILELHAARLRGELRGETPEARYLDYVARVSTAAGRRDLLQQYPVLARDLATATGQWIVFAREFLARLAEDRPRLADWLGVPVPGRAVEFVADLGDRHRSGRSVARVRFESGHRVVYKPRDVAVDATFSRLSTWANRRGATPSLPRLRVLPRDGYGWVEFVEALPCRDPADVGRYYRRLGALAALCTAFRVGDLHFENVIACADCPFIVDFEAALQPLPASPVAAGARDAAERLLAGSVLSTGLFPARPEHADRGHVSGTDDLADATLPPTALRLEDVGTDHMRVARDARVPAPSANVPVLAGTAVRAAQFADDLASGFESMYRLIDARRSEILSADGPLSWFRGLETRVVVRHTRTYQLLLGERLHPSTLGDAVERDRVLEALSAHEPGDRQAAGIIRAEIAALERGDVPLFTTRTDSLDCSGEGETVRDVFGECGLAAVERRLSGMSEADLDTELWLLRASLAPFHRDEAPRAHAEVAERVRPPGDPLGEAVAIGRHLLASAIRGAGDVTWLGLQADVAGRWAIRPLSRDLYDGLPGVILFLAYLGAVTGDRQWTAYARAALRALEAEPGATEPGRGPNGAFTGGGGMLITWLHLHDLWREPRLLAAAEGMVEHLGAAVERDELFDVMSGAAGCILAVSSFWKVHGSPRALDTIARASHQLLAHAVATRDGLAWRNRHHRDMSGLSHGAAGFAWALAEAAARLNDDRLLGAALDAFRFEESLYESNLGGWRDVPPVAGRQPMLAWCNGAPGVALARLQVQRLFPQLDVWPGRHDVRSRLAAPVRHESDCLCHGAMGQLDVLLEAGLASEDAATRLVPAAGTWRCGTPLGVPTPGLMTGLAGIGYQYLRLHAPDRVPSLLSCAPPPSP